MRFAKSHICVTRAKPRYPVEPQRATLEAAGCGDWADLSDADSVADLLGRLRRGDIVKVKSLHFLVAPKLRTYDNRRRDLWQMIAEIESRGASILEVSTGRSSLKLGERDTMIADAIEVITRGARALTRKQASENGKNGGRKPDVISDENRTAARALWFDRPELVGKKLHRALERRKFSLSRCYREFGPRGGRAE